MADTEKQLRDDLERLSHSTTAAELVKERGESKRVKVMSKSRLKELIHSVVAAELSLYADRLEEDERATMEMDAEKRISQVLDRAKKEEKDLGKRSEETGRLLEAIKQRVEHAGVADETLSEGLDHLGGLIAQSESMTHYCLHNMMCLKEEMDKLRRLVEARPDEGASSPPAPDEDTGLLRQIVRARCLLDVSRVSEPLLEDESVLDLAVLLDESPGISSMDELVRLNDAVSQKLINLLNG